jgi:hypothetical protein
MCCVHHFLVRFLHRHLQRHLKAMVYSIYAITTFAFGDMSLQFVYSEICHYNFFFPWDLSFCRMPPTSLLLTHLLVGPTCHPLPLPLLSQSFNPSRWFGRVACTANSTGTGLSDDGTRERSHRRRKPSIPRRGAPARQRPLQASGACHGWDPRSTHRELAAARALCHHPSLVGDRHRLRRQPEDLVMLVAGVKTEAPGIEDLWTGLPPCVEGDALPWSFEGGRGGATSPLPSFFHTRAMEPTTTPCLIPRLFLPWS